MEEPTGESKAHLCWGQTAMRDSYEAMELLTESKARPTGITCKMEAPSKDKDVSRLTHPVPSSSGDMLLRSVYKVNSTGCQ